MSELTYNPVGATRTGDLPPGYRHLRYRVLLGTGVFDRAADAVLTFRAFRLIRAGAAVAAPGVRVAVVLGPLRAPCEVVWQVRDEREAGFGYGTLPGHPATGEEAFLVTRDEQDRVWFSVTAFSRPAGWIMRLGGPFAVGFQHAYARLVGRELRRICTVKP